jgi:YHS domain-containing protein
MAVVTMKRVSRWCAFWLATVGVVVACGGSSSERPPAAQPGESVVKAPGDAVVGDTTRCPVDGTEFVVDTSSPRFERAGTTYFLCREACKHKVEAEPDKFIPN